jgi:hypothetical protein
MFPILYAELGGSPLLQQGGSWTLVQRKSGSLLRDGL